MTDANSPSTGSASNNLWLCEKEERAADLYLIKIHNFSRTNGFTTNGAVGKSWPQASTHHGLVNCMKKWQSERKLRFRSDLLYQWAVNLEKLGKISITVVDPKSGARNILTPKSETIPEAVHSSYFGDHISDSEEEGSNPEELMEMKDDFDPDITYGVEYQEERAKTTKRKFENKNHVKEAAEIKRRKINGIDKDLKTAPRFQRDKERFYQLVTEAVCQARDHLSTNILSLDRFWEIFKNAMEF
eukprot:TRINITY_DN7611_c0_g1_i2.p1 TRINITY_DN7611_c0_g1~~TRINITY_DN7611_c0_g1_i2.p1  ORF type:complete len:273 (-),score=75.26 TRINITY_DN7611_c0_g1_i2:296-1027(-)